MWLKNAARYLLQVPVDNFGVSGVAAASDTTYDDPDIVNFRQVCSLLEGYQNVIGENIKLIKSGIEPSAWHEKEATWEIIQSVKRYAGVIANLGNDEDVATLQKSYDSFIDAFKLEEAIPCFWSYVNNEQTPKELFEGSTFPEFIHQLLSHPISDGIIEWSEDGRSIHVPRILDASKLLYYSGILKLKGKGEFSPCYFNDRFKHWGFTQSGNNYTHPCFVKNDPSLSQRMRCVFNSTKNETCAGCEEVKIMAPKSLYCLTCVGEDPQFIPLCHFIDEDDKKVIFAEMKVEIQKKQTMVEGGRCLDPIEKTNNLMLPKDALKLPEMQTIFEPDKGWLDRTMKRSRVDYKSLDDLGLKTCNRTRDQLTHHEESYFLCNDKRHAIGHFADVILKAKCGGCFLCGMRYPMPKTKKECKESYAFHWDHYKPISRDKYVMPSHTYRRGAREVIFQIGGHCMLVCKACHDIGVTRNWTIDTTYVCQKWYEVPAYPPTMKEILNDKRLVDFRTVFGNPDFRYSGRIPKISTENLQYFVYKITGFILEDLVTWKWDVRYRKDQGGYFVNDIYLHLTKKIQGICCVCKNDIANCPPFKLTMFDGDHGEEGSKVKEANPSELRRKSSFDDIDKELSKLKGYCCVGCHGVESEDFGKRRKSKN